MARPPRVGAVRDLLAAIDADPRFDLSENPAHARYIAHLEARANGVLPEFRNLVGVTTEIDGVFWTFDAVWVEFRTGPTGAVRPMLSAICDARSSAGGPRLPGFPADRLLCYQGPNIEVTVPNPLFNSALPESTTNPRFIIEENIPQAIRDFLSAKGREFRA